MSKKSKYKKYIFAMRKFFKENYEAYRKSSEPYSETPFPIQRKH